MTTSNDRDHPLEQGSHEVEVDGLLQRYHVHGHGPVLVAHPGGPGIDWGYLRSPELEQHLTTVYVEPVGTGGSARLADPTGYTWERYATQVLGLADHLHIDRFDLLGHSAGGCVGLQIALDHPRRLRSLVLYNSLADVAHAYRVAHRLAAEFPARHPGRPEAREVAAAFADPAPIVDTDDDMSRHVRSFFPLYFADYYRYEETYAATTASLRVNRDPAVNMAPFDVRDRLPSVDVPTLVLTGTEDFICGPELADELMAGLPASRLITFDGVGHLAHIDCPQDFASAVTAFLA